jgi:micrococcal nuclease
MSLCRRRILRQVRRLLLLVGALAAGCYVCGCGAVNGLDPIDMPRSTRVATVVDGDTIKVSGPGGRLVTVRALGIDTPESRKPGLSRTECGAREATSMMLRLLFTSPRDTDGDGLYDQEGGRGRRVTLRANSTGENVDHYGRSLAWIVVGANHAAVSVQERLVRTGRAMVYQHQGRPLDRLEQLREAQTVARSAGRGVWSVCGGDFHSLQPGGSP